MVPLPTLRKQFVDLVGLPPDSRGLGPLLCAISAGGTVSSDEANRAINSNPVYKRLCVLARAAWLLGPILLRAVEDQDRWFVGRLGVGCGVSGEQPAILVSLATRTPGTGWTIPFADGWLAQTAEMKPTEIAGTLVRAVGARTMPTDYDPRATLPASRLAIGDVVEISRAWRIGTGRPQQIPPPQGPVLVTSLPGIENTMGIMCPLVQVRDPDSISTFWAFPQDVTRPARLPFCGPADVIPLVEFAARAVSAWTTGSPSPSFLLAGPPGSGKTSAIRHIGLASNRCLRRLGADVLGGRPEVAATAVDRALTESETSRILVVLEDAETFVPLSPRCWEQELVRHMLLDRLGRYGGPWLATSSRPQQLDPAFIDRTTMCITFPLAGVAERRVAWQMALKSADIPAADDVLDRLAAIADVGYRRVTRLVQALAQARTLVPGQPLTNQHVESITRLCGVPR